MQTDDFLKLFKEKVCSSIELFEEGVDRYRVLNPFQFDDGDHFSIVLKKNGNGWVLTDEGHTLMHLSYDTDLPQLKSGNRGKVLVNALEYHGITESDGAFNITLESDNAGNALFSLIQGINKISDTSFLSREWIKSTFMEDFQRFISENVPAERIEFDYTYSKYDPKGNYPIDCRINGQETPHFLFGILNNDKCKDVTISLLQYEKWEIPFQATAIFYDFKTMSHRTVEKFMDVAGKMFSSLSEDKRILKHIQSTMN